MAEIFALFMVVVAFAVVFPLAFPTRKKATAPVAAAPEEAKIHATGDIKDSAPVVPVAPRRAQATVAFPWRDASVYLVALLQAGIAVGVLLFAYSIYQATPTASESGGISSLNFFAQFWLGTMFIAATVAFSTGIFTYLRHLRYVTISAVAQFFLGCLFLLLGSWTLPITGALVVFAVCAVLVVHESRQVSRPKSSKAPLKDAPAMAEQA